MVTTEFLWIWLKANKSESLNWDNQIWFMSDIEFAKMHLDLGKINSFIFVFFFLCFMYSVNFILSTKLFKFKFGIYDFYAKCKQGIRRL